MNENIRIDLRISRKNVLLLSRVIEKGLTAKDKEQTGSILINLDEKATEDLHKVTAELLDKAGLAEMNEKLIALK